MVGIELRWVDANGNIIDKDTASLDSLHYVRAGNIYQTRVIIPDNEIPNSAGYPTVKDYLELEYGDDYSLVHMDQYIIVTHNLDANPTES